jgi:beta-lactamase regulating signal transducer with metallopeptidase domain
MSEWLFGTLLATSALVGLVLLVREPVRRRFGSRVTYGLWLIPAARLLMPTLTTTVERTVAYQPPGPPAIGEPLLLATVAEPSLLERLGGWPSLLLAVLLIVAAALFSSRMIAFHRDRRAILASGTEIARIGTVRVVRSPEIAGPVAFGILDRVIAVPNDFDRRFDAGERRLALAHELAHHQSGDLVANLFAFVLLCLQWFNPLAWVAHAAFRFDQEAACDARVLDKAKAADRADYGRAIAKAASGRALLFASALDRRNRLHRRLQSMLRHSNPTQRLTGRLLVGIAIAVVVPLTASRAIDYVDVPALAPHAVPPVASIQPIPTIRAIKPVPLHAAAVAVVAQPAPPAPPAPPVVPRFDEDISISHDRVTIDGVTKRWEELTPAEKDRVRAAVAKARAGLAKAHLDRDHALRDASEAVRSIDTQRLERDVARAKANADRALRGLDENATDLRRHGIDLEQLKAQVRDSMRSVDSIDNAAIQRAMAAVDRQKIDASLAGAEQAMRRAQAELDRIDARLREERR